MKTDNRLLNNFLLYLKSTKGRSQNTINSYEQDIIQLLKYLQQTKSGDNSIDNLDADFFNTIQYQDLEFFINYLTEKNSAASTRARNISAMREFFKYLKNKIKVIDNNPALELETPKLPKTNPRYLTLQESKDMLKAVDGRNKERDFAIVTLLLNLGLRVSELVNIDITDIKDDRVRVIRKGNEEKYLPLNKACSYAINQYLKVRPEIYEEALFLSEQGNRMDTNTVRYLTEKYGNINPHGCRHSCFSNLLRTGKVNIRQIQELANHKSINTTSIYTHITEDEIKSAVEANPYD